MQEHFGKTMNLARIKLMAYVIHALCVVHTVSLHKLAAAMPTEVERDSNMRRLQRFFAQYALSLDLIARMIFSFLPIQGKVTLSMDRTNWKFGEVNINILMLGITYRGIAFPLIFKLLPKRGNSNWEERKFLIQKFIDLFGRDCIDCLVADREFVGKEWIGWLNSERIRYYIRIRQNFLVVNPKSGEKVRAWHLFNRVRLGEELFYHKLYLMKDEYVYLAGARLKNSYGEPELQILICFNRPDEAGNCPIAYFSGNWGVYYMFYSMECCKT